MKLLLQGIMKITLKQTYCTPNIDDNIEHSFYNMAEIQIAFNTICLMANIYCSAKDS